MPVLLKGLKRWITCIAIYKSSEKQKGRKGRKRKIKGLEWTASSRPMRVIFLAVPLARLDLSVHNLVA